jgi:hypothetical protein
LKTLTAGWIVGPANESAESFASAARAGGATSTSAGTKGGITVVAVGGKLNRELKYKAKQSTLDILRLDVC